MGKISKDRPLYLLKSRGAQTAGDMGGALAITAPGAKEDFAKLASSGPRARRN